MGIIKAPLYNRKEKTMIEEWFMTVFGVDYAGLAFNLWLFFLITIAIIIVVHKLLSN
jgi:hypothetical protein